MNDSTDSATAARSLMELKVEHRDLDQAINKLSTDIATDQLHLTRMKKRKLKIKDMISFYESKLIPDLDA